MMKIFFPLAAATALVMPFIHPFGPIRQRYSSAPLQDVLRDGVSEDSRTPQTSRAVALLERACQDCHSERTQWPAYSYLPGLSWAIEKDVAEARRRMDLSLWGQYPIERKQDLLARIGAEIRSHRMPLPRYVSLHPQARLSEDEIQAVYEWTKARRRALRNQSE